jgi:hypothetical protein
MLCNGSHSREGKGSSIAAWPLGILVGVGDYLDNERLDIAEIAEAYMFRSRVENSRCREIRCPDDGLSLALHIHDHSSIIL